MDKFLGQDIPEQERWQFLQDNADAVEKIGYTHRFTPEELAQKKETLAEVSITINDIEIEKKEAMDEFKERLKPLNEEKQELLDHIKRGSEFVEMKNVPKSSITRKRWQDSTTSWANWFIAVPLCHRRCKRQYSVLTVKQEQNHERKQNQLGCA